MIPPYTSAGLLPPYVGATLANPVPGGVSPYSTDSVGLVHRFATTAHRVALLQDYFKWRTALIATGITGLHWVDGSFCEDIETIGPRPPGDIDVVNFINRPAAVSAPALWAPFVNANLDLLQPSRVKHLYRCHAFPVDVTLGANNLLNQTTYWFALFSHRKVTQEWKGLVALPLPSNDAAAVALLNAAVIP